MARKYIAALLSAPAPPSPTQRELSKPENLQPNFQTDEIPESSLYANYKSYEILSLSYSEQKELDNLKLLVQDALNRHLFTDPSIPKTENSRVGNLPDEISIWGVPLMQDNRSDVILLKFLRERDFNAEWSFDMFQKTIQWRKENNVDEIIDEDLGNDFNKVMFMVGEDKKGHPVFYDVFAERIDLYNKMKADEEKKTRFVRSRIQLLERITRKLDFSPGGISTFIQVDDVKPSSGYNNMDPHVAIDEALRLVDHYYPQFYEKWVIINVSRCAIIWFNIVVILASKIKTMFVYARPSKCAETFLKYISPEHLPIQYGGLCADLCERNPEFTVNDPASVVNLKPGTKHKVEIIVNQRCGVVWELRVLGWNVSYGAEFVPSYIGDSGIIIHKKKKILKIEEPVVFNSFKNDYGCEQYHDGKIILTIKNQSWKRKLLLYRFKIKPPT